MSFQRIGLFSRHEHPNVLKVLQTVIDYLSTQKLKIILESDTSKFLNTSEFKTVSDQEIGKNCDLLIAVGGDGNLLSAVHMVVDDNIPVAGVNCAHLGFLTDIRPNEINQKLGEILDGQYREEKRFLLQGCQSTKATSCFALNEITLVTATTARMIEFEIYIDDRFLCKQRSNGVIVATPTGSTAYALSAGGPILHPGLKAIVMAPMLSHTLSNRPIVIDSDKDIRLVLTKTSRAVAEIYNDNQFYTSLDHHEDIHIRKKEQVLRLIHPQDYDYFETLRSKLHWG